jgi:hypothetical protein
MVVGPKPPSRRTWREQRQQEETRILFSLPEINEPEFLLTWELEVTADEASGEDTRCWSIKHAGRVIYREPARHEDYHRFELLARLLRQKYGQRVKDLVPVDSNDASYYLYGDFLGAVNRVEAARHRYFHAK